MKKLLSIFLLASLFSTHTPKAEAGVVVGIAVARSEDSTGLGITVGLGVTSLLVVLDGPLLVLPKAYFPTLSAIGMWVMLGAVVLDADGSLPVDQLSSMLSEKYYFIDNQMVINDLAVKIKNAYEPRKDEVKPIFVSLTEESIKKSLQSVETEITSEQEQLIINDLK